MARAPEFQDRIEVLQGTLDLLILQTLAYEPQHGYGIMSVIRANSRNVLQVDTGSLYPALHRLEQKGWISSEWGVSDQNQRVKTYVLTRLGRRQLAAARSRWERLAEAIAGVLQPPLRSES